VSGFAMKIAENTFLWKIIRTSETDLRGMEQSGSEVSMKMKL
jgi:hypothetical protein